ncbi:hypothetical protein N7491_003179 [Penicillium cf. griseofulvum]|uniref:Uncharacterized protein n=1 Tax=Penicillium cf. griseofulvum TaxID=2972120 RepID=A0A9W9MRN7_9EURO|nr:hypothetical protein N7472_002648 [Penicillium cf. griseofulvum]KAJ5440773.1 hypothetical protein N7491_003179 [Penicillium cf. griseofulvum]KAJ5448820.1 hypothetical protein N7445_003641 [Penicillium cf. griseofulvum]
MDHKHFATTRVFPMSFSKTMHLIGILSWLQILYAFSYCVGPFWNTRREFPPFITTIERIETKFLITIFGTPPLSAYDSATEVERQWHPSGGNGLLNHENNSIRTTPQPTPNLLASSTWPQQGHPKLDSSSEQERPTSYQGNENLRENYPIYETLRRVRFSTRGSISKLATSAKAIFHQPLTTTARNPEGLSFDEERADPELVMVPVRTSQPRFVENVPFPAPMSAPARVADHFSDPGPATGTKGKQPVSLGATIAAGVNSETVQMDRARKYHSVESYPGKFPVSDSLDYSSLATAYAVRGRGTTPVRPFSDY